MRLSKFSLLLLVLTIPGAVSSQDSGSKKSVDFQLAQRFSCGKTCGKVSSCKEAVFQWCVCGYSRADGDKDGVPCEKLCGQSTKTNLERVRSYKRELGCK